MGLDITAYSKLKKLDVLFDADGEPVDPQTREPLNWREYMKVNVNHDFPGRADPLEDKACYAFSDSMAFRAGSYSGYNGWRETLADLAGYTPHQAWSGEVRDRPFLELVNFSDCEGTIGPVVAAKLAKDFAEWDERAKATGDERFYYLFSEWRKAFDLAAQDGAVSFH